MAFEAEQIHVCPNGHQSRGQSICPICEEEIESMNEAPNTTLASVIRSLEALITAKREEQARIRAQLDQIEPEIARLEAGLKALKGEVGAKNKRKGYTLNLTEEQRARRAENAKRMQAEKIAARTEQLAAKGA